MTPDDSRLSSKSETSSEQFGELLRFTVAGFAGGFLLGGLLDWLGFQTSAVGQWIVRTVSGEGESLLEGLYALRQRVRKGAVGMAEAYGWGKLAGMAFPWFIDWGSRLAGVDVYGRGGFYIPYFYALSDQIVGNLSALLFLQRSRGSWRRAFADYFRHPVTLSGLIIIVSVPVGLFLARVAGFSPTTQVLTALETVVSNLCWIPPLAGWISERRGMKGVKPAG